MALSPVEGAPQDVGPPGQAPSAQQPYLDRHAGEIGAATGPPGDRAPLPELNGRGQNDDGIRNVFVIGLDDFNAAKLQTVANAAGYRFLPLLHHDEVRRLPVFDFEWLLAEARRRIATSGHRVDALCSYWDFPVVEMVAVLSAEMGVPGPSLASVVRSQHKYWSRLIQWQVAPETVPDFAAVDPRAAAPDILIEPPYWLKPVRSFRSHLAYRIARPEDLPPALDAIRAGIPRLAEAYDPVLSRVGMPRDLAHIDGGWCVAEKEVYGRQCTLEGYMWHGEVTMYGTVDSIRTKNRTGFARYEYPSTLPPAVRQRMADISIRVVRALGYDDAPFNAEFFWDPRRDKIWLLELNARQSQSHADLFEKVDGRSNHETMVALALGRQPSMPDRVGEYRVAAKCFLNHDRDGIVTRVPSPDEIRRIEVRYPGTSVHVEVLPGQRLSELADQGSYTYELGVVFVGAERHRDLLRTYRAVIADLPLEIDGRPVPAPTHLPIRAATPGGGERGGERGRRDRSLP